MPLFYVSKARCLQSNIIYVKKQAKLFCLGLSKASTEREEMYRRQTLNLLNRKRLTNNDNKNCFRFIEKCASAVFEVRSCIFYRTPVRLFLTMAPTVLDNRMLLPGPTRDHNTVTLNNCRCHMKVATMSRF